MTAEGRNLQRRRKGTEEGGGRERDGERKGRGKREEEITSAGQGDLRGTKGQWGEEGGCQEEK